MNTVRGCAKSFALLFLVATLTLVIGVSYANAANSYPLTNFDFTITASRTLIRIQPGSSGSLVIWVNLFCTNSTSRGPWALCDRTVLQTVNLQLSGCPTGSYCALDRTVLLEPPLYSATSNFVVYSFSALPTAVTTITVTGVDQFGHSHAAQFALILCYC
jgi:hypothetical protein